MNEDQTMFIKTATTSAVGFSLLSALPAAAAEVTFAWLAVGTPLATVSHGLDYFGNYTGFLVFTDNNSPLQHAVVQCPGFRGHDFSQEGICTVIDSRGEQLFIKWQCSPIAPPVGIEGACDGEAEIVGGTGSNQKRSARSDFRAFVQQRHPDGSLSGYSTFGNDFSEDLDSTALEPH